MLFIASVLLCCRGLKDLEQDSSSMEKRFAYRFLKKLLKYVDSAQEFISHLGMMISHMKKHVCGSVFTQYLKYHFMFVFYPEAMAANGKTDRSPHEQEIKFFAKVGK